MANETETEYQTTAVDGEAQQRLASDSGSKNRTVG